MPAPTIPTGSPITSTRSVSGQQMRAIVQRKYGTADALSTGEIDRPVIDADDVLVQVRAAGLDRGTWHLMAGLPYALRLAGYGLRAPKTCSRCRCRGCVVAVGHDVTRLSQVTSVRHQQGARSPIYGCARGQLALKPSKLRRAVRRRAGPGA